jgi:uncharacterized membrane protein YdjX (TVP38/TMEM64 family)
MSVTARIALALLALALGILAAERLGLGRYLSPASIQELLATSGPLAPLTLMMLMATAVVVSPIPTLPLDIAAGAYFGPWLGTLYAALGALAGAVASFWIARWLGRDLVERLVGGHISFCTTCSDRLLTRLVFVSRLIPAVSFDVVSYGAGLTKMSVGHFTLATFLGMLPLTFAYVSAGRLFVGHGPFPIVAGVVVVAGLLALPAAIERFNVLGLRDRFRHEGSAVPDDRDLRARGRAEGPLP